MGLKRQAMEADFERRVRQRTSEYEHKACEAESALAQFKRASDEQEDKLRNALDRANKLRKELDSEVTKCQHHKAASENAREEAAREHTLRIAAERRAAVLQGTAI